MLSQKAGDSARLFCGFGKGLYPVYGVMDAMGEPVGKNPAACLTENHHGVGILEKRGKRGFPPQVFMKKGKQLRTFAGGGCVDPRSGCNEGDMFPPGPKVHEKIRLTLVDPFENGEREQKISESALMEDDEPSHGSRLQ